MGAFQEKVWFSSAKKAFAAYKRAAEHGLPIQPSAMTRSQKERERQAQKKLLAEIAAIQQETQQHKSMTPQEQQFLVKLCKTAKQLAQSKKST